MSDAGGGPSPGDASDVDPEALREDLDAIKAAMDIEDRYPGQARMWLVYGTAVAAAAIATNVLFAADLARPWILAIWFAMVGVVVLAQWRLVSTTAGAGPAVDWRQLFGAMVLGYVALTFAAGDLIATYTEDAVRGSHFFSHLLVVLGLTFLVVGVVLGAERIALRDRLPFYVGGAWMLALAAFVTHVRTLQLGGWAIFGGLFFVHSIAAYLVTTDRLPLPGAD